MGNYAEANFISVTRKMSLIEADPAMSPVHFLLSVGIACGSQGSIFPLVLSDPVVLWKTDSLESPLNVIENDTVYDTHCKGPTPGIHSFSRIRLLLEFFQDLLYALQ